MALKGVPPHLDRPDSRAWQQYNSAIQKAIKDSESDIATLEAAIALFAQTAVSDAVASTVSVTSSDVSAISSADAETASGTATNGGWGFVSEAEFDSAIAAVNTITTLANELKSNIASVRTLANEVKADVNTLKTDLNAVVTNQNTLIAALQAAGIIN